MELEHLNGVHVLIVEDDTDSRNVLAVLLQRLGALVEAVASAKEAYDRVSHRRRRAGQRAQTLQQHREHVARVGIVFDDQDVHAVEMIELGFGRLIRLIRI